MRLVHVLVEILGQLLIRCSLLHKSLHVNCYQLMLLLLPISTLDAFLMTPSLQNHSELPYKSWILSVSLDLPRIEPRQVKPGWSGQ